ncbi:toll/interleukin-1 receptor domain-containing protein [bacterium]|nr:toll/interleukin-1 receptor domain-containing protein [bacterium]
MTLLFISYKTNTEGVVEVKERLKQANYAIWFDKDAIRGGDRDWQAEIDRGIDRCDALVLCLTEKAAASEFVRYEIERMRRRIDAEQQRLRKSGSDKAVVRIFPVLFQADLDNAQIAALLEQVGLEARVQCFEPVFLNGHLREDRIANLLRTMRERDIAPSRFDIRKMQPDSIEAQNYRYYLRALIDHHKSINISASTGQRDPAGRDFIAEVDELFVPSPTEYKLVLKIENYDITHTWLCQDAALRDGIYESATDLHLIERLSMIEGEYAALREQIKAASHNPDDWNETVLDTLIEQRREELYHLKQAHRSRRLGRLDDVTQVITLNMIQVAALFRRVMFYGDSGIGKTTFARYMMVSRAHALLHEIEARLTCSPHSGVMTWPIAASHPCTST